MAEHTATLGIGAIAAQIAVQLYVQAKPGQQPDPKLADPLWAACKQQAAQLVTDMEAWATNDLAALQTPPAPTPPVVTPTPLKPTS